MSGYGSLYDEVGVVKSERHMSGYGSLYDEVGVVKAERRMSGYGGLYQGPACGRNLTTHNINIYKTRRLS